MWSFLAKIGQKKAKFDLTTRRPWAFKTSTFGITWCDNLWPNLRRKVAEGFHIRWRMLAAHFYSAKMLNMIHIGPKMCGARGPPPVSEQKKAPRICAEILGSRQYHSIQNDCRQAFFLRAINSNYRYRIVLPEQLFSITETDLRKFQQKSLITDTDSPLNSIKFSLQIQTSASKRINSVIMSATTVIEFRESQRIARIGFPMA